MLRSLQAGTRPPLDETVPPVRIEMPADETVPPVLVELPADETESEEFGGSPANQPDLGCIQATRQTTGFNENTASYLFTGM